MQRTELRRQLRAARRQAASQHPLAELAALRQLLRQHRLVAAGRIAIYVATGHEFPTRHCIHALMRRKKQVYAPRIRYGKRLDFVRIHADSHWRANRYGIPEPLPRSAQDVLGARQLDCVILPLLGFDATGQRLGTGGGYYDRSLAFRRWRRHWRRPRLVGLGYSAQQCDNLPAASWDVPLDGMLTEQAFIHFNR